MLIVFLLEILFYVIPLLLITYAVFLIVKTSSRRTKGFVVKILIYTVPALAVLHFAFIITEANKVGLIKRKNLRNGVYINSALGDTVKLTGDSIYILYAHKRIPDQSSSSSLIDTPKIDTFLYAKSRKNKKTKKVNKTKPVQFEMHDDVASTYKMASDTILMFSKNWDKKEYTENINHFFKKKPISGDVTGQIVIEESSSNKSPLKYHFALQHDTLSLNNGKDKAQSIQYIKKVIYHNDKPATAK